MPNIKCTNLKVIVDKNNVYSLSQFSGWSAKVKNLVCRRWNWLSVGNKEMGLRVAISVSKARVSKLLYLMLS